MTKQVSFPLGIAGISLVPDFDVDYLNGDLEATLTNIGLLEQDRPKPVFEVLVAHNPDAGVDLTDSGKSYLEAFDGMRAGFEKIGVDPVVLLFNPNGSGIHMASHNNSERELAVTVAKAGLDIGEYLGAKYMVGSWAFEHMRFKDGDTNRLIDPLKAIGNYAERLGIVAAVERLRTEETDVLTDLDTTLQVLDQVGHGYIKLQDDTCHSYANDGSQLVDNFKISLQSGHLAYVHISEHADWNTATNRGALIVGGHVREQLDGLFSLLAEEGYKGPVSYEGPHIVFKDALGRSDPKGLSSYDRVLQDQCALGEAAMSINAMRTARSNAESKMK